MRNFDEEIKELEKDIKNLEVTKKGKEYATRITQERTARDERSFVHSRIRCVADRIG